MYVTEDAKTTGERYDETLGMYLDVDAIFQGEPFWWEYDPERYAALKAARTAAGIDFQDELFGNPEDQEGLEDGLEGGDDDE